MVNKSNQTINRLVLASNNVGKLREFSQLLSHHPLTVVPQSEFGTKEVEETGLSFVENALIKARNAARHCNLPALADDSGIEIDALHGEPGIYSARYAGPNANDQENWQRVLQKLAESGNTDRSARFQCVIVFLRHAEDPTPLICQGTWEGCILEQPQGDNGFGYDPIFYVPKQHCSAAQLAPEIKNQLSHRSRALQGFLKGIAERAELHSNSMVAYSSP